MCYRVARCVCAIENHIFYFYSGERVWVDIWFPLLLPLLLVQSSIFRPPVGLPFRLSGSDEARGGYGGIPHVFSPQFSHSNMSDTKRVMHSALQSGQSWGYLPHSPWKITPYSTYNIMLFFILSYWYAYFISDPPFVFNHSFFHHQSLTFPFFFYFSWSSEDHSKTYRH